MVVTAVVFLAAGGGEASAEDVIRGTAFYRERIALRPGAVLEVTLEDVSRMDVPAEVIASVRIENTGNPPFRFEIPYDPAAIDERHTYSVRARITADEALLFTTDQVYTVLTRGAGTEVELLLRGIGGSARRTDSELEDTYWGLTHLGDTPVEVSDQQREPHLVLHSDDGRVAGFTGCNRVTGSYEVTGRSIAFSEMVVTMMACVDGMEYEQNLKKALGDARSWKITGRHLELYDENGAAIARFEAGDGP
jgi:putative lipoprotein